MKTFSQSGVVTLLVVIAITCLLLFLFQKMIWFVVPFLLALMLYYGLRPAVRMLVAQGMSHSTAAKTVWLLLQIVAGAIVLALVLLVTAKAGTWPGDLVRHITGGKNLIKQTVASLENTIPIFKSMDLSVLVGQGLQQFSDRFAKENLMPITLRLLKWLPSLLLIPYITYFMLNDSIRLKKYLIKSVPNAFFEKALLMVSRLDASLQNYFQGLMLLTVLDAACLAIGLVMLGVTNAIWLGLAAAVLAWIPYVGSIIGCVLVVLIAATDYPEKSGTPYACLFLFLGVRLLDDFIFLPLTIGRKLHVHPLLSVLLLFLGATVAGATGLILALPLFGAVAVIGETIFQIMADKKLITRYKTARQLVPWQEAG